MRGHMDPAEYKHVVLGLIFLKYISDAFEERRKHLETQVAEPSSEYYVKDREARYGIVEDRDEYLSENIFWVPKDARWSYLQANAKQPTIGKLIDDAMGIIEKENSNKMGYLIDRTHRELSDDEIKRIAQTYHAWRSSSPLTSAGKSTSKSPSPLWGEGKGEGFAYKDIPGFCKSANLEDIRSHGYVLTPGRYVGAEYIEDDGEPFDEKMKRLTVMLDEQFKESERLELSIRKNLKQILSD